MGEAGSTLTLVVTTLLGMAIGAGVLFLARTRRPARNGYERRLAEQALRHSEERLRLALDAGHLGIWDWNLATGEITWSRTFARFLSAAPSMTAHTFDAFLAMVHPDDRGAMQGRLAETLEKGTDYDVEFRMVAPDGQTHWVAVKGRVYRDDGRPVRMVGTGMDVSSRHAADEERALLLERERSARAEAEAAQQVAADAAARFKRLFDLMPVGLAVADDPECRRITSNPAFATMLGIDPDTNASKSAPGAEALPFRLFSNGREIPPDDLPMQRAAVTGVEMRDVELELVRADGRVLQLLEYVAPLFGADGKPTGSLGAFLDITERKRAEDALAAAKQQVERESRTKDEFLAMLGHELRNPLAAIRNAVTLAQEDPGERELALGIVQRQAEQLGRLVGDLLDVARISQGRIRLQAAPLRLAEVVEHAVDGARAAIESRGHRLSVSIEARDLSVDGDATRLEQVVANLLDNAAKYAERGGQIAIAAAREGAEAVIRVRDAGVGIAPEMLPRVFDLFVQSERTLDRAQGGLGIGLTIVRKLVELHGGRVEARSDGIGRGAEFVIRLPALPARPRSADLPQSEPHPAPTRVLVVEDNVDAATSLAALLKVYGHEVRVVHDGPKALAALAADVPEVMLVDIGLPGMDGYELARRVRAEPEWEAVVMIALTGYGRTDDRELARAAGFAHHLVKPVDPKLLRHVATLGTREATRGDPARAQRSRTPDGQ